MKQYQTFLQHLSKSGEIGKNPDGKIGISLPSYTLEYQFEQEKKRKIHGKPSRNGFPLITNIPCVLLSNLLKDINQLPIKEFEEFNRSIHDLTHSRRILGSLKLGKTIELPFLKKPDDIRVPVCKIIEPDPENHNGYGNLNLEITLYHYDVIWELPNCLDTITIIYCLLCIICDYKPKKITFTLIRPFCEDKYLKDLDEFLQRESVFKAMRIKPGLTSFFGIKKSDIEFSM